MKYSMVLAADLNNVIGVNNKLAYNLKEDMRYFKQITLKHIVVMGRSTFESIGKVLPDRTNVILTSDKNYEVEGAHIFNNIEDLKRWLHDTNEPEVMIIGGKSIYEEFLPIVDKIYLTRINALMLVPNTVHIRSDFLEGFELDGEVGCIVDESTKVEFKIQQWIRK